MRVKEQMKAMEVYMRLFFQVYQMLPEPEQCWTFRDFNQEQRSRALKDLMDRLVTCSRCGKRDLLEVEERYSFNVYAGRLCEPCCYTYRDHCGLDQPQGNPADLEEEY